LLTPTPPCGHHEPLMQQFFGEWYFSFGRSPG
jgi:hypothetical protein